MKYSTICQYFKQLVTLVCALHNATQFKRPLYCDTAILVLTCKCLCVLSLHGFKTYRPYSGLFICLSAVPTTMQGIMGNAYMSALLTWGLNGLVQQNTLNHIFGHILVESRTSDIWIRSLLQSRFKFYHPPKLN